MASRFLHLLSEERLDPEAVTNRLSLFVTDNDLVRRRPHASRARNLVAWAALQQSTSVQGQSLPKWVVRAASAYPPRATEERTSRDVSNVPISDIAALVRSSRRHGRAPGCDSHSSRRDRALSAST